MTQSQKRVQFALTNALSQKTLRALFLTLISCVIHLSSASQLEAQKQTPAKIGRKATGASDAILRALVENRRVLFEREKLEKTREILGSQFESRQFLVNIESEVDLPALRKAAARAVGSSVTSPLAPQMTAKDQLEIFLDSMPKEAFREFVIKINLKVFIDAEAPQKLVDALSSLILRQTQLRSDKGDKLVISRDLEGLGGSQKLQQQLDKINQEFERARDEKRNLETKVATLEGSLRTAETQRQVLESQRSQLESQKIQLETQSKLTDGQRDTFQQQITKLADELAKERELKKNLEDKFAAEKIALPEKGFLAMVRKVFQGAELPLTLIPVAILLAAISLIITFFTNRNSTARSKSLGQGIQILANAFQKSGAMSGGSLNDLSKILNNGGSEKSKEIVTQNTQNNSISTEAFELAKQEAASAWQMMMPHKSFVFAMLKDWLTDLQGDGPERFVSFLSAIGLKNAEEIWGVFPASELNIIRTRKVRAGTREFGFACVLEIYQNTEAIVASMPPFMAKIDAVFLVKMDDTHLSQILAGQDINAVALVFVFLTPTRASRILALLDKHNPEELILALVKLKDLAEDKARESMTALATAAQTKQLRKSIDVSGLVIELIENSGAEIRTRLTRGVGRSAELSKAVRSKIILIEDVFKVDTTILADLILSYETEDLASLFMSIDQSLQSQLNSLFTNKVGFSVRDEVARASQNASLSKRLKSRGGKIQQELITGVKQLINNGTIDLADLQKAPTPLNSPNANAVNKKIAPPPTNIGKAS